MEIDPSIPSTSSTALTNPALTNEKTSSTGSGPIYHSCKSPNFNYLAVGNEADKLKWLVLQHVKPTAFKKIFAPLMSRNKKDRMKRTDELTCVEACMLLRVLEPLDKNKPPIELEQACHGLINLLNTEKVFLNALDRIITKIIITAANEKIISLLLACQLLVTSIDFRMLKPPNPEKIQFVRKSMDQMDYKNMRDLLKLLLVEKLDKMHCNLTEYQHRELASIEELVIDLIDRRKNYCPALFFITEISRIDTDHSSIHFLPRVSLKIREMVASFRPLAEIGSMLGRSWMWPVPASPIFSWSSQTWSAWKLDEKHCKLYFKTHLPYSSENSSPQTYLQYILFKQPHGQDNLNHLLRPSTTQNPTPRLPCDEVIQLLILEAMCAMEDSEQPVLAPINQYNWLHLSHLVTYALSMSNCILSELLTMLLPQLKSCQYLRAKEELMWILLQYIAHAKSKEKKYFHQQAQQNATGSHVSAMIALPTSGGLGAQNRVLVLEIFNVLYGPDKSMNWGDSCSTEQPLNMVRFFAPAAIWINLVSSHFFPPGSEHQLPQPQPPEKLQTLIDFIEKQLRDNKEQKQLEKNPALLAVVANAYSNISEIFEEHVNTTIFRMLGQHSHPQPPPQIQPEKWALLGGRKTEPFLRALELSFLDSLTFHAKRQLYNFSFNKICFPVVTYLNNTQQQPPQQPLQSFVWRLASPALVESTARLLLSTELCDQNGQCFYQYAAYFLKAQNPIQSDTKELLFARNDILAMFLELLNFRLQNIGFGWKWDINIRLSFFMNVFEQLIGNQLLNQSPVPYNIQLCQLLEQTILRFAQCTWSQDMLSTLQRMHVFLSKWIKIIPELCRAFLLSALRAAKLLGDGQLQIIAHEIGWQWPQADIQWFPVGVQQILNEQTAQYEQEWMAKHAQRMMELEQASAQEMQQLFNLDADYFGLSQPTQTVYNNQTLLISIFRCLYQFQIPGFQVPQPMKTLHPGAPNFPAFCYKLLGSLGNRSLHILTNALVDWLAWKFSWLGQQQTMQPQTPEEYDLPHMLKVLNDMLFLHQFISIDRLLFSMTLHPTDDQSIRTLLCLLAALLDSKYSQLPERLHACYAFAPPHSQTTSSNSEDFFMQMSEYYKKYQEVSFAELYQRAMSQTPPNDPSNEHLNLPIYYGHLTERICPIVDVLLQRAIQTDIKPAVLDTLLRHFSPIYRIHPQPMTFIYTTLYSLNGILLQQNENSGRNVRKFVLEIVMKLEQEEVQQSQVGRPSSVSHAGKLLTTEFIQHDHQMPPIKFCRILVERIVQASTYTHQPPPFVHHDWRFAEFSPAAQALTSAWIELMASRYLPAEIVDALVQLAIQRPISRPLDTLNALGLLLTGLPTSFQYAFLNKIEQSFDWEQIADPEADPAQLFESLSYEVYLHSESRILSMLALIHSFCQHGGNNSLCIIPDLIINRLAKKVQNEAQLLYFLRIVVPYLQRIHEKERSRHMPEIVSIYEVLGALTQKIGQLRYEDTICDLLYQFKYMFVGYSLKDQTEQAIRTFPNSMREKLKFLLTHSSSVATETQQQQMQQILQQQQILHHQSSQGSLLSGPAPMSTAAMIAAAQQQQAATQFGRGGHQQQHVAGQQPHPSQFPSQIPPSHLQQPPPFGPQTMHGPSFDPAMAAAHQPALIEMLRRQSRESGGDGGPIPPPAGTGMSTTMGMGQSLPATTDPLSMASLSMGGGNSANASPNSQPQPPQFPTTSAPTGSQPQQLAPPPPYSQMHNPSGPTGMHTMMGPMGQMPSFPPGQMPITTSGGQFLPANFQQMMNAQQQMAAAQGQFLPGPPGQQPFIPHQLPPQQMGFASAAQQAQMVQMGGANRRPNSDDGQFPPQFQ